jgi:hypothetical protein
MVGGAWVLTGGSLYFVNASGKEDIRYTLVVDRSSLKVNDVIDPVILSVDGLEIEKGSLVSDNRNGSRYLHNDIPLELKIELANDQAKLESIAESPAQVLTDESAAPSFEGDEGQHTGNVKATAEARHEISALRDRRYWIFGGIGALVGAIIAALVLTRRTRTQEG